MNINKQLIKHPCFHITDFEYLRGQGKRDYEITQTWDEQLCSGRGPKVHSRPFDLKAV